MESKRYCVYEVKAPILKHVACFCCCTFGYVFVINSQIILATFIQCFSSVVCIPVYEFVCQHLPTAKKKKQRKSGKQRKRSGDHAAHANNFFHASTHICNLFQCLFSVLYALVSGKMNSIKDSGLIKIMWMENVAITQNIAQTRRSILIYSICCWCFLFQLIFL